MVINNSSNEIYKSVLKNVVGAVINKKKAVIEQIN